MQRTMPPRRVAVIGGGWAGCAAAVALTDAGERVTIYEQARELGGRARRVVIDGIALDNGQHLFIGAYRATLALLARLHGPASAASLLHRLPLTLQPFAQGWPGAASLTAPRLPAPLHLAAAMLGARGLPWSHRIALVNDFRRLAANNFAQPHHQTVAACFARTPRLAFQTVWEPLCLAALNTRPDRASARIFVNVLRAAFTGSAAGSDFLIPTGDLGTLVPDATARVLQAGGGALYMGQRVRRIDRSTQAFVVATAAGSFPFDAVVVAVGPHQLGQLEVDDGGWARIRRQTDVFSYESITTINLGYENAFMTARIRRLDDAPGQWVFDHGRVPTPTGTLHLLAVVISAGGSHDAQDHATLAANVDRQLRRLEPRLPRCRFAQVIAERRGTYACLAGLDRPLAGRVGEGLYLCGDYTDADFPATLEAAVRSGNAAANSALVDLGLKPV